MMLGVWSECVAGERPIYSPETIDIARLIISNFLAPLVIDQKFDHPSDVYRSLNTYYKGHLMAKAAVEMAAWNLFATKKGVSLATVLGGTQSKIPVGVSLGIQDSPAELVRKVNESNELGYRKVKIKIKPGYDLDYLKAVYAECSNSAAYMVDANNAYTLDDLDLLKQMDDFGLMMIEQPLAWDDVYMHRLVQAQLNTPVCLDESITSLQKAQEMVSLDSGRIVNIKPGRVGGLTVSLQIHNYCQQHNIPVWCGGMLESGVGRSYNVALASLENFTLPGDVSPSKRYWKQDVVTPGWDMDSDGYISVPFDQSGFGKEVDEDYIRQIALNTPVVLGAS